MVLTDEWDEPLLLIPLLPLLPRAGGVVRAGPYLVKRKLFANYSSKCYVSTDGFSIRVVYIQPSYSFSYIVFNFFLTSVQEY